MKLSSNCSYGLDCSYKYDLPNALFLAVKMDSWSRKKFAYDPSFEYYV